MKLYSQAERPELLQRRDELGDTWHEFMYHDAIANRHWDRQYAEYPDLQLWLVDDDDLLLAESNAVPIPFGPDELPGDGWDAAMAQAFEGGPARDGLRPLPRDIREDRRAVADQDVQADPAAGGHRHPAVLGVHLRTRPQRRGQGRPAIDATMKPVLVTGAFGQVGTRCTRILLDRGRTVIALDLRTEKSEATAADLESGRVGAP